MADFKIRKGLKINVSGIPLPEIEAYADQQFFAIYPAEFEDVKPRLKVKAGDSVKRGGILFENKKDERMLFRAPCAGTIKTITLGERRFPEEILIERSGQEESDRFETHSRDSLKLLSREQVADHLLNCGLWPLIRQRPFSKIADPDTIPKAVFINAANSAPFMADAGLILLGNEDAFQLGIDALARLTDGKVHLCKSADSRIGDFDNAESHTFTGKHPAGNTSVHINRISPILPGDTVYTLRAQDVILIGQLLQTGELPRTKLIALAGPGVKEAFRKYYRVEIGANLQSLLSGRLKTKKTASFPAAFFGVTKSESTPAPDFTAPNILCSLKTARAISWDGLCPAFFNTARIASISPPFSAPAASGTSEPICMAAAAPWW